MRIEDAPPAGWYPDPEGTSRLRFWEGTDWSDRFRARPVESYVDRLDDVTPNPDSSHRWVPDAPSLGDPRLDTASVVDQVRMAAREEAERAADLFAQRARAAGRQIEPLISQYTSKVMRWVRVASVVAIVVLVAWVLWQVFLQVSLFEWIGDRIDNLTESAGRSARSGGPPSSVVE